MDAAIFLANLEDGASLQLRDPKGEPGRGVDAVGGPPNFRMVREGETTFRLAEPDVPSAL